MQSKNIEVVRSKTHSGLRDTLKLIKTPFSVTHMYHDGQYHYAWLLTDRPYKGKFRKILESRENN